MACAPTRTGTGDNVASIPVGVSTAGIAASNAVAAITALSIESRIQT
jgi:hypothetical protein